MPFLEIENQEIIAENNQGSRQVVSWKEGWKWKHEGLNLHTIPIDFFCRLSGVNPTYDSRHS